VADLEPSQMNRFDCRLKALNEKPIPALEPCGNTINFKTKDLEVAVNTKTGLIDRYRARGVDCVGESAFEPLVIGDNADPWGMLTKGFRKVVGRFKLMDAKDGSRFSGLAGEPLDSVRVIEDGPARTVIEALFAYGDSFVCQRYKLPKFGTEMEVQIRVYWNQKEQMLKLSIPTLGGDCKYIGQAPYGVSELPNNGNEAVAQKWVAVVCQQMNFAVTCINDGIYSSDFSGQGLRLTLLRSPAYSCHPHEGRLLTPVRDRFTPRIDQGHRMFTFWFNAGKIEQRLKKIDREALTKNEKPFALSFFPSGAGKIPKRLVVLSDDVVQITAVKRPESNDDLIVRLFEPTGKARTTTLSLPFLNTRMKLSLEGFEIKTLRFNLQTRKMIPVNLLEEPL
jgi:alpha-mannosidase